jgi:hypothetical protein
MKNTREESMTEKYPYINRPIEEEGISLRELLLILIRGKKTIFGSP